MKLSTRIMLMTMMFLQFFVWGAWYGQMSKYMFTQLGASGVQVGNAYATFSIGMIVSPFFMGMIADRYFSAQKVLGVLNLLGAFFLWLICRTEDPGTFFWVILMYCLTFAPTLVLASSISMQHMTSSEKEFSSIRVIGTVAWIIVTNIIGYYALGDKVAIFEIAMYVSFFYGIFAFFLPDTPPKPSTSKSFTSILGLDAFRLFKDRSFTIFFISSMLICIPLSFYYALANPSLNDSGMLNVENKMSLGQVSEVVFILLIPFAFQRFGVKWMLIAGLVAWILRFIGFGFGDAQTSEWMLYLAIALHGISYDFIFITGHIYTDNKADVRIRSSAQGLFSIATYGLGMGIGSWIAGVVADIYTVEGVKNWSAIWMVPAGIAVLVLVLFVLFFKSEKAPQADVPAVVAA
ncbi:MFS transporter [Dyadobacter sp. CY323]|uniref:MFS transporter n=1 Tax=Dyadobacter sp. CY323 TaxID=2907302 RepID=UPI001F3250E5|nr:MFS transporter [Dyadobacter sp. CY323]MCE6990201.1 MFS transporter [Dyadobacter sp. CY323]